MESRRGRKGKGFASLLCVHWRWQHRKVVLYRQSNLAASLHEKRERDVISSLHMLPTEAEVTKTMLATLCCASLCSLFPQRHLHQDHIRTAMASLLQAYDRKWQTTSYPWSMSWESISKCVCVDSQDRPALICRILSGILCRMACWNQPCPSSSTDCHWEG